MYSEIEENGFIIKILKQNLKQHNFHDEGITRLTSNPPKWPKEGTGRRYRLNEAIEETIANYQEIKDKLLETSINEKMIRSFYNAFNQVEKNHAKLQKTLEEYLDSQFKFIHQN